MRALALGALTLVAAGCGPARHAETIPGIRMANARVGPPLEDFDRRRTIAGKLPNTPRALARWVRVPQRIDPGNDMPDLGLSRSESRDVAAYLLERT